MAANRKKQRPSGEVLKQAARSERNKKNRIARAKLIKKNNKSPWYINSKLGNRLRRLKKKILEVGPDRKPAISDRIVEIEKLIQI